MIDWAIADRWWVQLEALIWDVFPVLRFAWVFGDVFLGGDLEERMVQREVERQRRRGRKTPTGELAGE